MSLSDKQKSLCQMATTEFHIARRRRKGKQLENDKIAFGSDALDSAVARVSEAPPEISRGAPHTLLAYYYELQ